MKNRSAQISMIVCTMIAAALFGMVGLKLMPNAPTSGITLTQAADGFGGPFTLTGADGKPFATSSIGPKYRMIYFGFTTCPAICPTELGKMTDALTQAGADVAARIQPIFITIDPARDTPDVMKDYLTNFYPGFVGLTGAQAEIDAVTAAYKVYVAKIEDPNATTYTMDHSSYIFVMSPADKLLKMYKMSDSAAVIAADLKALPAL